MEQTNEQLTFDFFKEKPEITAESGDELSLKIGEFAGPLDLLLFLIKQEQANIFDIPIAKITDEYLRYLRLMKKLDISIAGDFLVMAATLIEIKSKMLLPKDPLFADEEEELEDPRKALVDRLLEYEKFKSAANMLWEKSTVEQSVFPRGKLETDENNSEINVGVFDLLNVFQKILARHKEEVSLEIEREEMSLSEMLSKLQKELKLRKTLNVMEFFRQARSKKEMVLVFIAVLEIVRTESVKLVQKNVFDDILLKLG